jgi:hypothetical protein
VNFLFSGREFFHILGFGRGFVAQFCAIPPIRRKEKELYSQQQSQP